MKSREILFKSLADVTRQRLLGVLSTHELSVSEMVEVLGQPQSTISRHLKVLREAGLLIDRRVGATALYAARPANACLVEPDARVTDFTDGRTELRDHLLHWVSSEAWGEFSVQLALATPRRLIPRLAFRTKALDRVRQLLASPPRDGSTWQDV